ncbi:hypothetical protein CPB84DRAFT_1811319 [Gymnopilus junonius]|uniref:Xylanolytic transcriptional activator regulatory domain-containing protein n=1 Tax=Gymnopilus junonius TaxID=109634 RepID=A0A9P5P159_GYMJU|nr:hypothetical protein CPB84DRAFT_1811319 [Gymnopilus junonius]
MKISILGELEENLEAIQPINWLGSHHFLRLKLKCDKKLPCSSCVRRGCPSICPNGSLSTGQGTSPDLFDRFVLADTSQLHTKIAEMGQRIRELEDALAIFQAGVSNETHPLLREELLSIKFGPEKGHVPQKEPPSRKETTEPPIDAFGTMTMGEGGEGKYFGPSAGSEAGADLEPSVLEDDCLSAPISLEIARLSASFPFGSDESVDKPMDFLFEHLPPEPRAWSLCETYMEQATWMFRPIKREELIDDILSPIYKTIKEKQATGVFNPTVTAHKLATMFLVFAMGALVDLTLEPYNREAEMYYQLGRASLSLRSVLDSPEISTVQAVLLMASYHSNGGQRYTMDSAWALVSLGSKMSQSVIRPAVPIDLNVQKPDRDSSKWHMDSKTVQRRRALFWELFSCELFYSFALGRPPSIRLSYVDCEFPDDDEATLDDQGNTLVGYYRWKYEFSKEIFASVIELTLTAQAPQYQTILDLDRKVREKTFFPHLNAFISPEGEEITPSLYMKRGLLGQYRSITLLYLHRSFFAQAMLDHPSNPLQSPYSPSFLAAYRVASGVIKSTLNHYDRFPELCGRWWGIWTHRHMAASAFIELGLACDLFEKGAMHSRRARSGLAILYKMRQKAFQVYSQFRSGNGVPNKTLSVGRPDYGDDELALFGGQTRVLVSKLLSNSHKPRQQSRSSSASVSSVSSDSESRLTPSHDSAHHPDTSREVHPSLVEYLSMFPPPNISPRSPDDGSGPANTSITSGLALDQQDQALWQSLPPTPSLFTPLAPETFNNITSELSPFSGTNFYEQMERPTGVEIKTDPDNSLVDLGMMMTGESGMDEQWMSFMRDSGLLQGAGNNGLATFAGSSTSSAPYAGGTVAQGY